MLEIGGCGLTGRSSEVYNINLYIGFSESGASPYPLSGVERCPSSEVANVLLI